MLKLGFGITNLIRRATAGADELEPHEYPAGAKLLARKANRYRPRFIAILGLGAYRMAFGAREFTVGLQDQTIERTRIWVLPNPSGLNAHYQRADLAEAFSQLRRAAVPAAD